MRETRWEWMLKAASVVSAGCLKEPDSSDDGAGRPGGDCATRLTMPVNCGLHSKGCSAGTVVWDGLAKVVSDLQLALIDPPGNGDQNKPKCVENFLCLQRPIVPSAELW
jgi:hypothetical protein